MGIQNSRYLRYTFILALSMLALVALLAVTPASAWANELYTTEQAKQTQSATTSSTKAVYWIVNKKTGENLYTPSANEVNVLCNQKKTWTNKGIMWYAPTKGAPVYRLVSKKYPYDHHFTKSANEVRVLTKEKKTWNADFGGKPVFYSGGSKPIWRHYNDSRYRANKPGTHMFTTTNAKMKNWKNEGKLLYAVSYASTTTTVWVVSKIITTEEGEVSDQVSFSYLKNGLVEKVTDLRGYSDKYTYDSKNHPKSFTYLDKNNKAYGKTTYSLNNKGQVTKGVNQWSDEEGSWTYTEKFTYDTKGRLTKISNGDAYVKYTYGSDGRVKTETMHFAFGNPYKSTYSYDKKGFLVKAEVGSAEGEITDSETYTETYTNTYKDGLLTKQVTNWTLVNSSDVYDEKGSSTTTYTYKKISVPKSVANVVKKQQQNIIFAVHSRGFSDFPIWA